MADGDVDMVIASRHDNTSAWYESDGSIINHTIDIGVPSACTIIGIDIETLCAIVGNDTIPRYINNGNGDYTKQGNDLALARADGIFAHRHRQRAMSVKSRIMPDRGVFGDSHQ